MAFTYAQVAAFVHAGDDTANNFMNQVAAAIAKYSFTVSTEAGTVTNHNLRYAYATRMLNLGVEEGAKLMALSVALACSINNASNPPLDSDVDAAVQLVWNMYAGA